MTSGSGASQKPYSDCWDSYWKNSGRAGAYSVEGVRHPAVLSFWREWFRSVRANYSSPRIIDIACGNGAIVELALAEWGAGAGEFTCVDGSPAAVSNVCKRFPGVRGVLADAAALPFDGGTFDVVTSQFGVEYAGVGAVHEAVRLLAPAGRIALLLHHPDGVMLRESEAGLDAIRRVRASGFVQSAAQMLDAGFAAVRGAPRQPYEEAAIRLADAIKVLDGIFSEYGRDVAGGTIAALYGGVAQIHEDLVHYESSEAAAWLRRMEQEMESYEGRLDSMTRVTIGTDEFEHLIDELRTRNLSLDHAGVLRGTAAESPLGWLITGALEQKGI